jgi:uncharacterized protein
MEIARTTMVERLTARSLEFAIPTDDELLQPAGCFVTLHELISQRLRGCIGRLEATLPLWQAVRYTAGAVLADPRFTHSPITVTTLANLQMEISVLSPLKPAAGVLEFDLLEHGIYLTCGERSGCFLPQVARETGWSRQQLLTRLCAEKLGLPGNGWQSDGARLSTFTVEVIGPEPV